MKWRGVLVVLICLLYAGSAWAEFYRYRDANGVLRFTDNLAEVPENQRPKIKQYGESTDEMTPEQKAAKTAEDARKADEQQKKLEATLSTGDKSVPADVNSPGFIDYLNRMKVALDGEYAALMKEKSDLDATKSTLKTNKERSRYQAQVIDLNSRIKDFNRRRDEYKAKADAFNAGAKPK